MTVKDSLDSILRDSTLKPHDGITYCNIGVYKAFHAMGFDCFWDVANNRPMTANAMIAFMEVCPIFRPLFMDEVIKLAPDGDKLIVLGQPEAEHGHVAVIYPSHDTTFSGHWQRNAPEIANIGKENKKMFANFAFQTIPKAWLFLGVGCETNADIQKPV